MKGQPGPSWLSWMWLPPLSRLLRARALAWVAATRSLPTWYEPGLRGSGRYAAVVGGSAPPERLLRGCGGRHGGAGGAGAQAERANDGAGDGELEQLVAAVDEDEVGGVTRKRVVHQQERCGDADPDDEAVLNSGAHSALSGELHQPGDEEGAAEHRDDGGEVDDGRGSGGIEAPFLG